MVKHSQLAQCVREFLPLDTGKCLHFKAKAAHTQTALLKPQGTNQILQLLSLALFSVKFKLPNEKQFLSEAVKNNSIRQGVFAGHRRLLWKRAQGRLRDTNWSVDVSGLSFPFCGGCVCRNEITIMAV